MSFAYISCTDKSETESKYIEDAIMRPDEYCCLIFLQILLSRLNADADADSDDSILTSKPLTCHTLFVVFLSTK